MHFMFYDLISVQPDISLRIQKLVEIRTMFWLNYLLSREISLLCEVNTTINQTAALEITSAVFSLITYMATWSKPKDLKKQHFMPQP